MTQVSSTVFKANSDTLYADNTTGNIGAADLRAQMDDITDSITFKKTNNIVDPTVDDDDLGSNGNGTFGIGDLWINESANTAFVCLDNSTNNALWADITFSDAGQITASGAPAPNEIAVWSSATNLQSTSGNFTYDGVTMLVTGDITVTGTVDGRDIAADGTKLDLIPSDAISNIAVTDTIVDGSGAAGSSITAFNFETGDGIAVDLVANEATVRFDNNRVTADTADRTLTPLDNFSFITNKGTAGEVTWVLPQTDELATSGERLVATFFKTENQVMNIVGFPTVTVNGVVENGGGESVVTICPTPYTSFATVVMDPSVPNAYFVYQGANISKTGTTFTDEVAYWAGDGLVDGDSNFTYNTSTGVDISNNLRSNTPINLQTGTAYTVLLTDRSSLVSMNNAAANTLTIPPNATTAFPIGTKIAVVQAGAGATTINADTGVTLNGAVAGSGVVTAQWDEVTLYKVDTDVWYVTGDIGAVA